MKLLLFIIISFHCVGADLSGRDKKYHYECNFLLKQT